MFDQLPQRYPRHFCPENLDGRHYESLSKIFEELRQRIISSTEELEQWILDSNELFCVIQEAGSRLYVQMVCDTADQSAEKKYFQFVEDVQAKLKIHFQELALAYLEHRKTISLPAERYFIYHRSIEHNIKLFCPENIPLDTEATRLVQQYSKLRGAMTLSWEGEEKTLSQLDFYLQDSQREVRERAWRAIQERKLQDREKIDDIFDQLFELRIKKSQQAGFSDFPLYQFAMMERFDYTPEDCIRAHKAAEKVIVPYIKKMDHHRKDALGVDILRPWDLEASPYGAVSPPFATQEELIEKCLQVFQKVDGQFYSFAKELADLKLLDLVNRKNKGPGGFQLVLSECRYPFIFMNAIGVVQDLKTVFHEFGHSFHSCLSQEEPLLAYRHSPMEFAEVASMTMELFSLPHWDVFYSAEELAVAQFDYFASILKKIPWFSIIDTFQHELYTRPKHNRKDRKEIWLSVFDRFGGASDWTGLEDYRAFLWQKQLHLFHYPFYYMEYFLARMGSLQLWIQAMEDPDKALASYKRALSFGGSKDLPQLFQEAGIELMFDEDKLAGLMEKVMGHFFKLEESLKAKHGN